MKSTLVRVGVVLLAAIFAGALLVFISAPHRPAPRPVVLRFSGVTLTNGFTAVSFTVENFGDHLTLRSASLLAPDGPDWRATAGLRQMLSLSRQSFVMAIYATNEPRKFVVEMQERATGLRGLKDRLTELRYRIVGAPGLREYNGRKFFVTNDVPFVAPE